MISEERLLDNRQSRRMASEARFEKREDARWDAAEQMIGELVRDGKTIHYVYPVGGRYKEGSFGELVAYLKRNRYV